MPLERPDTSWLHSVNLDHASTFKHDGYVVGRLPFHAGLEVPIERRGISWQVPICPNEYPAPPTQEVGNTL
jgi:hypothetical protein